MPNHADRDRTRLVLVTAHTFGLRAFEGVFASAAFLDLQLEVALIIGLDEAHAAATVGYQSLAQLAAEQGVPFVSTPDGRLTSLADRIRAAKPDYILVIGWSALIPEEVLLIPAEFSSAKATNAGAFGCIGMHPTRLPQGRGQAPIPWTIIKGNTSTALSVFFLETGADTGPIIAQYDLSVRERETAASLFYRIAQAHFAAGLDLAERLATRHVTSRAQDNDAATRWPRRRPRDGAIRDTMTCHEVDALVRGLLGPYPRAFVATVDGGRYVRAVERVRDPADGGVFSRQSAGGSGRIRFRCADGLVDLIVQSDSGLSGDPGGHCRDVSRIDHADAPLAR